MTDAIPDTMTAIEISEPGGPEVLKPTTRDVPKPGEGEVLVRVQACGVNRPDALQRGGNYPPPPGASDIPGLEIAGTVVAIGDGVSDVAVGDVVCALVTGGGYAEYCVAPAAQCLPVPDGMSVRDAACLPETLFTVWSNVFDRCALQPGETFLVHGGSSGIGTTAIQLAKAFGATVFTTAGSDEKCAKCVELGADVAINYRTQDYVDVIKEKAPKGVNVVLDMVGGDYIARDIKCMAVEGRHCSIAFLGGPKAEVNFGPVMMKRLVLTGSTLRARDIGFKRAIRDALSTKVWPLLAAGSVKPIVFAEFPMSDAAGAHALMESSSHIGKIVLIA